jgi:hypothetical protein
MMKALVIGLAVLIVAATPQVVLPGSEWATIVDPGKVYPSINQNPDAPARSGLRWPSAEVKRQAGENAWGAWRPKVGDEGEIVWKTPHPAKGAGMVYILKVGTRYVPIGEKGIRFVQQPRSPFTVGSRWTMCNPFPCKNPLPAEVSKRIGNILTLKQLFGEDVVPESLLEVVKPQERIIRFKAPGFSPVPASALVGSWSWRSERTSFYPNGTGMLEDEGKECYRFKYTVSGNTLTRTADGVNDCTNEVIAKYRISIHGNFMVRQFIGTGFITVLRREE